MWIAPVQIAILPITENQFEFAKHIADKLKIYDRVVVDEKRKNRIQNKGHESQKVPYMIVVGEKEKKANKITIRQHRKGDLDSFEIEDFISKDYRRNKKQIINYLRNKKY